MSRKMQITLQDDVYQNLQQDSTRFGLSMSGYISQLIMQKNIELSAAKALNALTGDQLREQIKLQLGGG